jgi:hypothetical protein
MTTFQMPEREKTLKLSLKYVKMRWDDSEQLGKYNETLGHFLVLKFPSICQNEGRSSVAWNGQMRTI